MSKPNQKESCLIVLNPRAGAGKAKALTGKIKTLAAEKFKDVEIAETQSRGHATAIATTGCENGKDVIIAVGGDGTCHEVINGMITNDKTRSPKTVFALIPMGTGSDLQKTIGAPKSLQEAINAAADGVTKICDIGKCAATLKDGSKKVGYFINVAGFGANGEVVRRTNESSKKWGGMLTFLSATLITAIKYQPVPVRVEWINQGESTTWEKTLLSCFIANGSYCGSGMWIGPNATMTDGRMDYTLVPQLGVHKQLIAIPRLYKGTVGGFPGITVCHGQTLRATPEQNKYVPVELDGEMFGQLPAKFSILPGLLKIRSRWP